MRLPLVLALPAVLAAALFALPISAAGNTIVVPASNPRPVVPTTTTSTTTSTSTTTTMPPGVPTTVPAAPQWPECNGHPRNAQGFVLDGFPQCPGPPGNADEWCVGTRSQVDACDAAMNGGYVANGDPQLDDRHCVGSPYQIGQCMIARRFWPDWQPVFGCLDGIVNHEDPSWDPEQYNTGGSSAYGIPQALPGSKMASAGDDWATNPVTQIRWLVDLYSPEYGGICGAWDHEQIYGTY